MGVVDVRGDVVGVFRRVGSVRRAAEELGLPAEVVLSEVVDDFLEYARLVAGLCEGDAEVLRAVAWAQVLRVLASRGASEKHVLAAAKLVVRHVGVEESSGEDSLSELRRLLGGEGS